MCTNNSKSILCCQFRSVQCCILQQFSSMGIKEHSFLALHTSWLPYEHAYLQGNNADTAALINVIIIIVENGLPIWHSPCIRNCPISCWLWHNALFCIVRFFPRANYTRKRMASQQFTISIYPFRNEGTIHTSSWKTAGSQRSQIRNSVDGSFLVSTANGHWTALTARMVHSRMNSFAVVTDWLAASDSDDGTQCTDTILNPCQMRQHFTL